jgi:hypothetical protein
MHLAYFEVQNPAIVAATVTVFVNRRHGVDPFAEPR